MEVPDKFSNELKNMVNTFIWSTKKGQTIETRSKTHTQLCLMAQQPIHGGCKFLDLESQINAFATRWLQRLIDPTPSAWKDFVWNKIHMLIEDHPLADLPREFILIGDIPLKLKKRLMWKLTGVWKRAFKTFFANPSTPTPIEKRNIYDLRSTYIYYNKQLLRTNRMLIEPTHIPELATLSDIWDEEQDNIITINELRHKFPLHGNRKINAFHKIINKLKEKIVQLFHNASTDLPLPLIIKNFSNHYLINEDNDIYATNIDQHTQAHTIKYKMHPITLKDLNYFIPM